MFSHYSAVLVFAVIGIGAVAGILFTSRLLRPRNPYREKLVPYECGEDPKGSPWIRFNIRFYVVAIIFIVFEVEMLLLLPWAIVFQDFKTRGMGPLVFWEGLIFLLILGAGLVYVWKKGFLEWVLTRKSTAAAGEEE